MVTNLSRVYAANNEVVTCDVVLDATDEPTFRTFYKTTLAMGTQWFNGDILRNGVYENYELCFIGAPPVFTPIAHNVVRASFTLLTRGDPLPEPVYELTATQAVNINATAFALAASQPSVPGGTVVTINTLSTDRLVITKPSIAADPALTWNAHSRYNDDSGNGGLSWFNAFIVSDETDAFITSGPPGINAAYATAAASQAGVEGLFPQILTGHTQYQFWYWDTPVNDNRGGLSLRVETYSLVP